MSDVRWLGKEDVLAIHDAIVSETGEAPELLNEPLLKSALAKPLNLAAYENPTFYDLAASYAEGIARNHSFANGNKRTAFVTADVFLKANGIRIAAEMDNEHIEAMVKLAQGLMSREEFARHLEAHSIKA